MNPISKSFMFFMGALLSILIYVVSPTAMTLDLEVVLAPFVVISLLVYGDILLHLPITFVVRFLDKFKS